MGVLLCEVTLLLLFFLGAYTEHNAVYVQFLFSHRFDAADICGPMF